MWVIYMKNEKVQKKLWTVFIFLIKFLILAIPLHLILWSNMDTTGMQTATASQTAAILTAFGLSVKQEGIRIFTDTFTFLFVRDCTAWKAMLAFLALVVATPFVSRKSRIKVLGLGLPAIYVLNLIRTSTTIAVGIFYPNTLEFVHTILWREMMLVFIFGMWLYWFKKTEKTPTYAGLDKMNRLFFNLLGSKK